ncbi:MAG: DUF4136 domain-containing protein [Colwellia sp.]|nr:DUF4136 domain-containing protein [Colwellia sp.]MCW8866082.1 DUF4136 domain-containing protein [Colwellia sp.]MCW9083101.1 DUF4136 domain-containing protein [Colwellia sp.]
MKNTTILSVIMCAIFTLSLVTGCSTKPSTKIDFNPNIDFASFTSFQFGAKKKAALDANPIMSNRIQSAVEENLSKKDLTQITFVDSDSADLTVRVNFSQHEKANNSSFSIGLGTGRVSRSGGGSIGVSTNVPIDSDATVITKITIDMSHHGVAVWHGVDSYETSGELTVEEINNAVNLTVNRLLENFPPQKVTAQK